VSGRIIEIVFRHGERRHRASHGDHLRTGHRLASEVAERVVDGLTLGLQLVPHHDDVDQFIVDVDVRAPHGDKGYTIMVYDLRVWWGDDLDALSPMATLGGCRNAAWAPGRCPVRLLRHPVRKHRIRSRRKQGVHMRTYSPKPEDATPVWHVIDANDVILGRLATHAAALLRGKHKPTFAPHMDMGDFVIVINAEKVALTGGKLKQKMDYRHSGFPGGLRKTAYADLIENDARRVIEKAVKGMLPHNKIGRQQIKKLKVYTGDQHPHAAQMPVPFTFTQVAQ
jgi:large subunit ribosomal protein L13